MRLIREVPDHWRTGPGNGMRALQAAMRSHTKPEWFHVGGQLQPGEIPWYWCWEDGVRAARCESRARPYIVGPNMLFAVWDQACAVWHERVICQGNWCVLHMTESSWYSCWIAEHLTATPHAPIEIWPYPIDPIPEGPGDPKWDLLIFRKSPRAPDKAAQGRVHDRIIDGLERNFRRNVLVEYGSYQREHLAQVARRSRACVYLSDSDRGPLALAEILLSGCPAVGHPTGAPWCFPGRTGLLVEKWTPTQAVRQTVAALTDSVELLREWDRRQVRRHALYHFDVNRILTDIYLALGGARRRAARLTA